MATLTRGIGGGLEISISGNACFPMGKTRYTLQGQSWNPSSCSLVDAIQLPFPEMNICWFSLLVLEGIDFTTGQDRIFSGDLRTHFKGTSPAPHGCDVGGWSFLMLEPPT